MDRNTVAKILNAVVIVGGVLLGWWLVQPVSAAQEQVYMVQAGDTLAAVAARLGVSEDTLITQNAERYPKIADGRLWVGWELTYTAGDHRPRWQKVLEAVGTRVFGEDAYRSWWADVSEQRARVREEQQLPPEQAKIRGRAWDYTLHLQGKGTRKGYSMPIVDADLVYMASVLAEAAKGYRDHVQESSLCKECKRILLTGNVVPDWAWEEVSKYNRFGAVFYTLGPRVSDNRILLILAP